jgi:proton glutamate symport protein
LANKEQNIVSFLYCSVNSKWILWGSLATIALASAISYLAFCGWLPLSELTLAIFRWLAIGVLVYYGFLKKNLTTTILVSMVLGVEVGLDFPEFSQNLKVVSQIFLRLIKSIIAPLLFGTLVYGIAGHSNIKQVGRMGWKSILYFEVVTTICAVYRFDGHQHN